MRVSTVYTNPEKLPTRLTLETITHEGTSQEQKQSYVLSPANPQAKPVVVHLTGGRRKTVLPFVSPQAILESMFGIPGEAKDAKARKNRLPAASANPPKQKGDVKPNNPRP